MDLLLLVLAEGDHPPPLLDPHGPGLVFWTAITFGLVALVLYKFAWGPVIEALDRREQAIAGRIDQAKAKEDEAERTRLRYEEQLESVRQEAQSIINEGEADKQRILQEARAKATKDAAEIRQRADRDIRLSQDKALAEIKEDATSLGMLIAEKVLQAEIDPGKHQRIINDVIGSYERS